MISPKGETKSSPPKNARVLRNEFRSERSARMRKTSNKTGLFSPVRTALRQHASMAEAGIEPNGDFDATGNLPCGCVICEECRAARALRFARSNWPDLASLDVDLQSVHAVWDGLPVAIRNAVLALIRS
jgi:hypothetical protein